MQKLLKKKIARAIEENDDSDGKKPKLCHERCHGSDKHYEKRHQNKHDLCYHDTDKYDFVQACRKHVQPTHRITEQQRLWQ
eukprot:14924344-Ditylum_brightwellii.AAC.1